MKEVFRKSFIYGTTIASVLIFLVCAMMADSDFGHLLFLPMLACLGWMLLVMLANGFFRE